MLWQCCLRCPAFNIRMRSAQDYINIELDSHRNQLIQLELLLTAAMFAMALVTVVAGLFGMNLYNKAEDSYVAFILVRPSLFGPSICEQIRMPLLSRFSSCSRHFDVLLSHATKRLHV